MRRLWSSVAILALASAGAALALPEAGPSGAAVNPVAALRSYAARYGSGVTVSPAVETSGANLVAALITPTADMGNKPATIVILGFNGSTWGPLAVLGAKAQLFEPPGSQTPILVAHLTGGDDVDFFVSFAGADHTFAAVASNAGGHWHLVGFRQGKSLQPTVTDAFIGGNYISSTTDNCVPNCAAGKMTHTNYIYSPALGAFVPWSL